MSRKLFLSRKKEVDVAPGCQQQNSVRVRNTAGGRFFIDEAVILVFQLQAVLFLYKKFPRADRLHRLCRRFAPEEKGVRQLLHVTTSNTGLPHASSVRAAQSILRRRASRPCSSFCRRTVLDPAQAQIPESATTEYMGAQGKKQGVPSLSLVHDRTSSQRRAALVSAGRLSLPAEPELQRDVPHFCPG